MDIVAKVEGEGKKQRLVLSFPMVRKLSKSEKNMLIATTGGNQSVDLKVDGKQVTVGLNAWISAD